MDITQLIQTLMDLLPNTGKIVLTIVLLFIYPVHKYITDLEFRNKVLSVFDTNGINFKLHSLLYSDNRYKIQIKEIHFGNHTAKNKIFQIILETKVKIVLEEMRKLSKQSDILKLSPIELENVLIGTINDSMEMYEVEIMNRLQKLFGKNATDIYNFAYENGFKLYHNNNVKMVIRMVRSLKKSSLKPKYAMFMYFNFIQTALDSAVLDCEEIFTEFNGQLDKYNDRLHIK